MTEHTQTLAQVRLLFNVQYPDYEAVWLEGYDAALCEADEISNPYDINSKAYQFWQDGWWAGCLGEAPLFDLEGHVLPERLPRVAKACERVQNHAPAQTGAANDASFGRRLAGIWQILLGMVIGGGLVLLISELVD